VKEILSSDGRRELEGFAAGNVLLAFDYDGTLAPIVADPRDAALPASTWALLEELSARYPCALISGRARGDLMRFVAGLPLLRVVGNHGVEGGGQPPAGSAEAVARWRRELSRRCGSMPGVWIEDKTWSLAVHYRRAPRRAEARTAIVAAAAGLTGARVVHGKQVVNLVPIDAAHKGAALDEICRQLCCDTAIYAGDDVTDEDVFGLGRPASLLSVRVGHSRTSSARWYVRRQSAIDELLTALLAMRAPRRRRAVAR
jgi:trehalose 6-phosphate phosphatase